MPSEFVPRDEVEVRFHALEKQVEGVGTAVSQQLERHHKDIVARLDEINGSNRRNTEFRIDHARSHAQSLGMEEGARSAIEKLQRNIAWLLGVVVMANTVAAAVVLWWQ